MSSDDIKSKIDNLVRENKVLIFMKGTPEAPQCGFSKATVDIFRQLGASIKAVDVLGQPDYREGVKAYTNWPTIPQVFINGKFIGGCDIVRELNQKGELANLVKEAGAK